MSGVKATVDIVYTIGTLERILSELLILADSGQTDAADRATLRRHAEEMRFTAHQLDQILDDREP